MERSRAARAYLGDRTPHKDQEMAAFMAIFHPEIKGKRLKRLLVR